MSAPPLTYLRVFTDEDGHSRFEDVPFPTRGREPASSGLEAALSQPIATPGATFRHVLREADERPHNAPRRQFIVLLAGRCEIETSRGERRRLGPGAVVLVEDTAGRGHVTRRIGDEERLTLVVPLTEGAAPGADGIPGR